MFVYIIINSVNRKYYVGKTVSKNLQWYFNAQIAAATRGETGKPHLYNAIRKHGAGAFSVHVLNGSLTTDADIKCKEIELIALLSATNPKVGYNITCGGDSGTVGLPGTMLGRKHTELTRKKMSKVHKERGHKPVLVNRGIGKDNPFYGKSHSESTRQKIREANAKRGPVSQETRDRLRVSALRQWQDGRGHKGKENVCAA